MILKTFHFMLLMLTLVLSVESWSHPALAQQPPLSSPHSVYKRVELNARKMLLTDVLETLSKQLGHNIFVDGEPLRKEATIEFSGDGADALDRVADMFDCTWEEGRHGAILMRKRFTRPEDKPQFNRAEWLQVTRNILDIFGKLDFDHNEHLEMVDAARLFHSFTPEQMETLKAKKRLYLAQMPVEQQELARQWIYNTMFARNYGKWQHLWNDLDAMPASHLEQRLEVGTWMQMYYNPLCIGQPVAGINHYVNCVYGLREPDGITRFRTLAVQITPTEKKP